MLLECTNYETFFINKGTVGILYIKYIKPVNVCIFCFNTSLTKSTPSLLYRHIISNQYPIIPFDLCPIIFTVPYLRLKVTACNELDVVGKVNIRAFLDFILWGVYMETPKVGDTFKKFKSGYKFSMWYVNMVKEQLYRYISLLCNVQGVPIKTER